VNDLDDADDQIRDSAGFINHPYGVLIAKIVRHLRVLTNTVRDLKTRLDRIDPGGG